MKTEEKIDMVDKDSVLKIIEPRLNSSRKGSLEYQRLFSIMYEIQTLPVVAVEKEKKSSIDVQRELYNESSDYDEWKEN